MPYSNISLKETNLAIFAHEAAHARHYAIHQNTAVFSKDWLRYLEIKRRTGEDWRSRLLAAREGLVDVYAAFDHTQDEPLDGMDKFYEVLRREQKSLDIGIRRKGVQIIPSKLCVEDRMAVVQNVLDDLELLPLGLAAHVSYVRIIPDIPFLGVNQSHGIIQEPQLRSKCTEDVAVHTQHFIGAFYEPHKYRHVFDLLNHQPKTQKRLKLLYEHEFITREMYDFLKDKDWRRFNAQKTKQKP